MIIAHRVAGVLKQVGVGRVYGVPGEDHMTLLDALADVGVAYESAVSESSAVIMATAEAKLSGRPGVAIVSIAPGMSNAMNGLAHAYLDAAPVLVISGNFPAERAPFVVRQRLSLDQLVAPIVKWSCALSSKMDVVAAMCEALDVASADRAGPVFVELPDDVARCEEKSAADLSIAVITQAWKDRGQSRLIGPQVTPQSLSRLKSAVAESRRPVIVVGGHRSDISSEALRALSVALRSPVFVSSAQKGLLSEGDEYFAGTFLNGSLEANILSRADLLLWFNPEAFDFYNRTWPYSMRSIAITPTSLSEWLYPFWARIIADPEDLACQMEKGTSGSLWAPSDVAEYRKLVRESLLVTSVTGLTVPESVQLAIDASPEDVRIVADAGFTKPVVALLSNPSQKDHYFASHGLSTMGYSIPAAIAVARHQGGPVVSFVGDGSLLMRVTELIHAHDLKVPLVIIAIIDGALSQIEIKQERLNLKPIGTKIPDICCRLLARSLGIQGVDVSDGADLRAAVSQAFEGEVTLIGVHLSPTSSRQFFDVLRG